jgi:hypothetical protein
MPASPGRGRDQHHCGCCAGRQATLNAQWQSTKLSLLGRLNYFGETTRVFNLGHGFEPEQTCGSTVQLDTEIGYRLFDGVQVCLGVSILLDEYPDRSSEDIFHFGKSP